MDIFLGELTPQQQKEWEMYLNALNEEENERRKQKTDARVDSR